MSTRSLSVVSQHPDRDDLILLASDILTPTHRRALETHVEQCAVCSSYLERAQAERNFSKVAAERREEPRFSTNDPATLRIVRPFFADRASIKLLDISKSGSRISVPFLIPIGSEVQIRTHRLVILGEVRHCTKAGKGYEAGIRMEDVYAIPSVQKHHPLPNSDGHVQRHNFIQYLRGRLTSQDVGLMHAHLLNCSDCHDLLTDLCRTQYDPQDAPDKAAIGGASRATFANQTIQAAVGSKADARSIVPFAEDLFECTFLESSAGRAVLQTTLECSSGGILQLWTNRQVVMAKVDERIPVDEENSARVRVSILEVFPVA